MSTACFQYAKIADYKLGTIGQVSSHPLTLFNTDIVQRISQFVRQGLQFRIIHYFITEMDSWPFRKIPGTVIENSKEWNSWVGL